MEPGVSTGRRPALLHCRQCREAAGIPAWRAWWPAPGWILSKYVGYASYAPILPGTSSCAGRCSGGLHRLPESALQDCPGPMD